MHRPRVTAAAVTIGALALAGLGSATATAAPRPQAPAAPSTSTSASGLYVVRVAPHASVSAVARQLRAAGATGVYEAAALHLITVKAPAGVIHRFAKIPGVARIDASHGVKAQSLGFDPASQAGSMTNVTRVTKAQELWKKGVTGKGVDVAVIDTGIAPVGSLNDNAKVVVGPDLSLSESNADDRYLDTFGHGTAMAGIIAGRETNNNVAVSWGTQNTGGANNGYAYAQDTQNYYGMAPDARLINLKLADQNGVVDVTQMIAAINWVVQNKNANGMNIRVLNLSYGTESPQSPQQDPLSYAAEQAWKNGIVVVASAGNEGGVPGLANPAYNPWVLAVGAVDTKGTDATTDDVVPAFSARQGGNFGNRPVDVVAPGVGIVSPGVNGSYLWDTYSSARVGNGFFRGSGTSQAAAVVSGGVALLLQNNPGLTPNQVKAVLQQSAKVLTGVDRTAQGFGEIDLLAATTANPSLNNQNNPNGTGQGSIESARGGVHITIGNATLQGEMDVMGNQWNSNLYSSATANRTTWGTSSTSTVNAPGSGSTFLGFPWLTGAGFSSDTTSWAGRTWSGRTWSGRTWSGATWQGGSWSGRTWSGRTWSGSLWSGSSWSSPVASSSWASSLWASSGWK
ncbi:MAG: S8 family serine peptidase [Kineosporiaceae bacterium]